MKTEVYNRITELKKLNIETVREIAGGLPVKYTANTNKDTLALEIAAVEYYIKH